MRRLKLFRAPGDYRIFFGIMKKAEKRFGVTFYSYCLMGNHFHLEIGTGSIHIGMVMSYIMGNYARSFNYKYGCSGHVFESRYSASIIENFEYFLEVSRYIHRNPVKARMVKNPQEYPYSSYGIYLGELHSSKDDGVDAVINGKPESVMERALQYSMPYVDARWILSYFSEDSIEDAIDCYRFYVEKQPINRELEASIRESIED